LRCPTCHRRIAASGCPHHGVGPTSTRAPGDSAEPDAPAAPDTRPAPPSLPGVSALTPLAEGGFAWVFAGRRSDVSVVLKLARAAGDARFAREAAALAAVGPPTVPGLLAQGIADDGRPWILMERIAGASLAELLTARPKDGAFVPAAAAALLARAAHALDRMHARGWVHRDIKPENLHVRPDGELCLLDLGLARPDGLSPGGGDAAALVLTRTGEAPGTPTYQAPERTAGAPAHPAEDRYALAVVAFELVTGRPPFTGEGAALRAAHAALRPPRAHGLAPLPVAVDDVFDRALAKAADARHPSATAFVDALADALAAAPDPPATRGATHDPRATATPVTSGAGDDRRVLGLLQVSAACSLEELAELMQADGHVERVLDDRTLLACLAPTAAASARAAQRAAHRLLARRPGASVVMHVAPLRVRVRGAGVTLGGAALARPETWWATPGPGLTLTPQAAALLGAPAVAEAPPERPAPPDEPIGREPLVAALADSARAALAGDLPSLLTLIGGAGTGKSHVLAALGRALAPDVRVIRIARPPGDDPDWAIAALLGAVDAPPGAHGHAATRLAAARLAAAPSVVLLDDGEDADAAALDALERATDADQHAPIAVVIAARALPRPGLGDRAGHAHRNHLPPLPSAAARALLRRLLLPAEFVSEDLLAALETQAAGLPRHLVELAGALWQAGAIRRHPSTHHFYVAADEILHVSATPLAERLARRALAALPPELATLAQLAAVLRDDLAIARVDQVARGLRAGDAAAAIDPGVGLDRLVHAGLLVALGTERAGTGARRHAFADPAIASALEALIPAERRQVLHAAALAHYQAEDAAALARIAHHAERAGHAGVAVHALAALAAEDAHHHRWTLADQRLSAALALGPDPPLRAELARARARARTHGNRLHDALADVRTARAAAAGVGALVLALDEATILDWLEDFAGAATLAEQVFAALAEQPRPAEPGLPARAALALGRARYRAEHLVEAVPLFEQAADGAADHETRVIALVLLAPALVYLGRLDHAERVFATCAATCEQAGDLLHLGVTLVNRTALWSKRADPARHAEDARRAIALGRELGNLQLERAAAFDLAEHLHRAGASLQALPLVQRSAELARRMTNDRPPADDAVLLARVLAVLGDRPAAATQLAWAHQHAAPMAPALAVMARLAALLISPPPDDAPWAELVAAAAAADKLDERREVLAMALAAARRRQDAIAAARWHAELEVASQAT
jgi:hypothetical protein